MALPYPPRRTDPRDPQPVHGSRLRCSPPTKLGHTAVAKITDDLEQLLAFYDYPAEHWIRWREA